MAQDGHYREIAAVQLGGDEMDEEHPSHMRRVQDDKKLTAVTEAAKVGAPTGGAEEQM